VDNEHLATQAPIQQRGQRAPVAGKLARIGIVSRTLPPPDINPSSWISAQPEEPDQCLLGRKTGCPITDRVTQGNSSRGGPGGQPLLPGCTGSTRTSSGSGYAGAAGNGGGPLFTAFLVFSHVGSHGPPRHGQVQPIPELGRARLRKEGRPGPWSRTGMTKLDRQTFCLPGIDERRVRSHNSSCCADQLQRIPPRITPAVGDVGARGSSSPPASSLAFPPRADFADRGRAVCPAPGPVTPGKNRHPRHPPRWPRQRVR